MRASGDAGSEDLGLQIVELTEQTTQRGPPCGRPPTAPPLFDDYTAFQGVHEIGEVRSQYRTAWILGCCHDAQALGTQLVVSLLPTPFTTSARLSGPLRPLRLHTRTASCGVFRVNTVA